LLKFYSALPKTQKGNERISAWKRPNVKTLVQLRTRVNRTAVTFLVFTKFYSASLSFFSWVDCCI